jgi:hypothetical protein
MTKDLFELILEYSDILTYDIVELEVFNPNYKWSMFKRYPKTLKFEGCLGYTKKDEFVNICVYGDAPLTTKTLYYNINQIVGIKKRKKITHHGILQK